MKKYFILFLVIGLMSCNNSDDDNGTQQDDIETWNMTQRLGFGGMEDYNEGDVDWTLNMDTQMLQIENNVQNASFNSGLYPFSMTNNSLTVEFPNDTTVFALTSQGSTRTLFYDPLPNAVDDELTFTFTVN